MQMFTVKAYDYRGAKWRDWAVDGSQVAASESWDENTLRLFVCAMCLCAVGGVQRENEAIGQWNVLVGSTTIEIRKNDATHRLAATCDLTLAGDLLRLDGTNLDISKALLTKGHQMFPGQPTAVRI